MYGLIHHAHSHRGICGFPPRLEIPSTEGDAQLKLWVDFAELLEAVEVGAQGTPWHQWMAMMGHDPRWIEDVRRC